MKAKNIQLEDLINTERQIHKEEKTKFANLLKEAQNFLKKYRKSEELAQKSLEERTIERDFLKHDIEQCQ